MQQYFIDKEIKLKDHILMSKEHAHHISHVLRMKEDTKIRIVDHHEHVFLGHVNYQDQKVYVVIDERQSSIIENIEITLYCALIKVEKFELMIQKATELGVHNIVPFMSDRTIIKFDEKKLNNKLERWQKISREASEQCNRTTLVTISKPIHFDQISTNYDVCLLAYEDANVKANHLYQTLLQHKCANSIACIIGPEGGFTQGEVAKIDYVPVSLGQTILRAETAAIAMLSNIRFFYDGEKR